VVCSVSGFALEGVSFFISIFMMRKYNNILLHVIFFWPGDVIILFIFINVFASSMNFETYFLLKISYSCGLPINTAPETPIVSTDCSCNPAVFQSLKPLLSSPIIAVPRVTRKVPH